MKHIKNIWNLAIAICAMILAIAYFIDTGVQGIESGKSRFRYYVCVA